MTIQLIKYNIGILMLLNGKRMLLLIMALKLANIYNKNPHQPKNPPTQWISLLFHQHSRASTVVKQQLQFMMGIFMGQAMMQLGFNCNCLPADQQRRYILQQLLEKSRKRKNASNKYYQLNLQLIDRFYKAQKQFYLGNKQQSIQLLLFSNIQNELQKMPQNKIITNIYSSLSYNNIGLIHFSFGMPNLAMNYFNKSQLFLSKGCTGVQDKDLQLFSSNYSTYNIKILYNLGLTMLSSNTPSQAYAVFQHLKKLQIGPDYKYWYRMGQSQLQHYHQSYSKVSKQNKQIILQGALKSFSNCLYCLQKSQIPSINIHKQLPILKQQQIQSMINKIKGQSQIYTQNVQLIISYICLLLGQYNKVIKYCKQLIGNKKVQQTTKIYALQYMMQAYTKLQRHKNALQCINQAQQLNRTHKRNNIKTCYFKKNEIIYQKMEMNTILAYQNSVLKLRNSNKCQKEIDRNKKYESRSTYK